MFSRAKHAKTSITPFKYAGLARRDCLEQYFDPADGIYGTINRGNGTAQPGLNDEHGGAVTRKPILFPGIFMSEPISVETFNHLVGLAALELDAGQAEYLRRELNNQLKSIHELEAIPLDDAVQTTSHGVPYTAETSPSLREDVWLPNANPEEILAQAPDTQDGYIVVPDIPHTTLE